MLVEEELTEQILGAAIEVHKALGPGLLESVYEECLCHEFGLRSLSFERQVEVPLVYKGARLAPILRLDVIVEGRVILEIKSVDRLQSIHDAQLLTYLKLTGKKIGLLLIFNEQLLRKGLRRIVL